MHSRFLGNFADIHDQFSENFKQYFVAKILFVLV